MYDRGTGRTTKQLQDAPKGAQFYWCNGHIDYPIRLARCLDRADIKILPRSGFRIDMLMGADPALVVIDHAFEPSSFAEREAMDWHHIRLSSRESAPA